MKRRSHPDQKRVISEDRLLILKSGKFGNWNQWRKRNPLVVVEAVDRTLRDIKAAHFNLAGADFSRTTIDRPDFSHAILRRAVFRRSCLSNATMPDVDLRESNLAEVSLCEANLRDAKLFRANLKRANLTGSNLTKADLRGCNLSHANLKGVDLSFADLREANLVDACFDRACLTGARLWETQRSGWSIQSVGCENAFWDRSGIECTPYAEGEFQKLHSEFVTVDLEYEGGLGRVELDALPLLVRHLETLNQGARLRLHSIEQVPGGARARIVIEAAGDFDSLQLRSVMQSQASVMQKRIREEQSLRLQVEQDLNRLREAVFPLLLERATLPSGNYSEKKLLTVLFMDLKGFSNLEPAERANCLQLVRGLMKPILDRWHASHIAMWGDALRATFLEPVDALACANSLVKALGSIGINLRVGMDRGEVLIRYNTTIEDIDIEGDAVNFAARLEPLAPVGGVLVSPNVRFHEDVQRSSMEFLPKSVVLSKSVGSLAAGSSIDCFTMSLT